MPQVRRLPKQRIAKLSLPERISTAISLSSRLRDVQRLAASQVSLKQRLARSREPCGNWLPAAKTVMALCDPDRTEIPGRRAQPRREGKS